jgi:hypothetical protein
VQRQHQPHLQQPHLPTEVGKMVRTTALVGAVIVGLGRIATLRYCSSTLYQFH